MAQVREAVWTSVAAGTNTGATVATAVNAVSLNCSSSRIELALGLVLALVLETESATTSACGSDTDVRGSGCTAANSIDTSHVENGAVNGDTASTIRSLAKTRESTMAR